MRTSAIVLGAVAAAAFSVFAACGSSSNSSSSGGGAPPCTVNPFQCPAGQTCWVTGSPQAPTASCLNSGKGKIGDPCALILGTPDCGDGLVCLMAPGAPMGQCTPYCDPTNPAHACPNMESCVE